MQMACSTAGGGKGNGRGQLQVAQVTEALQTLRRALLAQRSASQAAQQGCVEQLRA